MDSFGNSSPSRIAAGSKHDDVSASRDRALVNPGPQGTPLPRRVCREAVKSGT
jgi:hypothetical protein